MTVTEPILPATDADTARLSCQDVTVRFGGLLAVNDVSLAVPSAGIVGLVGPNGAGKSTLFAVFSGLLRPTRGVVRLDGEDVTDASPQHRATLGLARTFQHPELFAGLTVRDHLVLAHRVRHEKSRVWSDLFTAASLHRPATSEQERVDGLIELLGLGPVAARPAVGMPLGVARLIELGRALATDPNVLLLDEPSSGLDSAESEQLEATLTRVAREREISVLLVEHDVELVMRMCATIHVLDFGSCIAHGTPTQIRADAGVRAAYLGEAAPAELDQSAATAGVDLRSAEAAIEAAPLEAARRSEEAAQRLRIPSGQSRRSPADIAATDGATLGEVPALVVQDVSVRYGEALVLSGVSFELVGGRALAVLGPNGAGKSSLARALSGLVPLSSGSVALEGVPIEGWAPHRIRRAGIVHLPEGRGVFRNLSVLDNVRMAAQVLRSRGDRRQAIDLAFETFPALADRRRQVAGSLSGGEQQMLSLARALATSPKLIIADEMSLGLAPMLVDLVFEGLERARQAGVTVLMIEQYVHRALAFAETCIVLNRGRVAWSGPAREAGTELLGQYLGSALTANP